MKKSEQARYKACSDAALAVHSDTTLLSAFVFLLNDVGHFFGSFHTSSGEPHFDNRIDAVAEKRNMIFDVLVPFDYPMTDAQVKEKVQAEVWERLGKEYYTVIQIDRPYTAMKE